MLGMA